jgi:hypothetical protein
VARYDARYARDIGRYALNAAASARLFQGVGLDWDHQDHKDWKDRWDPEILFSYEAVTAWDWSSERKFRPYATGDPVRLGWDLPKIAARDYYAEKRKWFANTSHNLALYMGNHVGFLGGIMALTDVSGILRWDCLATDWFHAPAYPTYLFYNPYPTAKTVHTDVGPKATDLYDAISHRFIQRNARGRISLTLAPEKALVLVCAPANGSVRRERGRTLVDGSVLDYAPSSAGQAIDTH